MEISSVKTNINTIIEYCNIGESLISKGCNQINPINSNNFLISNVGLAGVLTVLFTFTEATTLFLEKHQYLCLLLSLAMNPRMTILVLFNF